MSSDPKPEDIKKTARNEAMQWYRRIENRVAPVVAFGGLIIENTTRWAYEKRDQHYYTTYYQAKKLLKSPCTEVVRFLRAREIEAMSSLWDLSWGSPTYSNPRKVYPLIRETDEPRAAGSRVAVSGTRKDDPTPLPVPLKNTPSE